MILIGSFQIYFYVIFECIFHNSLFYFMDVILWFSPWEYQNKTSFFLIFYYFY